MAEKKGKCHAVPVETTTGMSTELVIANVVIYQDAYGRYNLNSLHQASEEANNPSKSPGQWVRLKATKKLMEAMDRRDVNVHLQVVHGGDRSGTYAHELLAVAYASWISPDFHLTVNQAFLDMKRGLVPADPVEKYPELRAIRELIIATAEARDEALLAREEARKANANAHRALETQLFFTVAEYVYVNKLSAQLPESGYKACSDHLRVYCLDHNIPFRKQAIGGKRWTEEYAYHVGVYVDVLPSWLKRRYAQSTLHVLQPSKGGK